MLNSSIMNEHFILVYFVSERAGYIMYAQANE